LSQLNIERLQWKIRKDLLDRYARRRKGRPTFCTPPKKERTDRTRANGNDGKVMFETREAAEECARFLTSLGSRRLAVYRCPESGTNHWHLATVKSRKAVTS
jgi:hypothetical protein